MDTKTKQELEAFQLSMKNFISSVEDDSQVTDEVFDKIQTLSQNYMALVKLNLGVSE